MKQITRLMAGAAAVLLLASGMVLAGCPTDGDSETNAAAPIITVHPQDKGYSFGATTVTDLSVTATVTGTPSYQWYSNTIDTTNSGTAVGTNSTFKPPIPETGTTDVVTYYYVVVTNTDANATGAKTATATSRTARITATNSPITNAATPAITVQPQSASYTRGATAADLSVTATATGSGTLSYQWYRNTANSTSGGTIVGTNNSTFTPPTSAEGTLYYYVVVTNTDNTVKGERTATVTSTVVAITVTAPVSGGGGKTTITVTDAQVYNNEGADNSTTSFAYANIFTGSEYDAVSLNTAFDNTSVQVSGGKLTVQLGKPKDSALKSLSGFQLTVQPADAKVVFVNYFCDSSDANRLRYLFGGATNGAAFKQVQYWYADKAATITGTLTNTGNGNYTYNLTLASGWNEVLYTWSGSGTNTHSYTAGTPDSSYKWTLRP